jgi:hypothetical protein
MDEMGRSIHKQSQKLIQSFHDNRRLFGFANWLMSWLITAGQPETQGRVEFTESRAKALLRSANVIDDPTLHTFARLIENETAVRLALYDLVRDSGLATSDQIVLTTYAQPAGSDPAPVSWLALIIAAYAWKNEYPLHQLDPASPPDGYSPAGQVVKRAATLLRQQVQRSATERDKLGRLLAFNETATGASPLNELRSDQPIAPLPPHFRPPIPVRYPEVARETLQVDPENTPAETKPVAQGDPLTITPDDLPAVEQRPVTMPPIHISPDQIRQDAPSRPARRAKVVTPSASTEPNATFTAAVRQMLGRDREPMTTTKLRVVVQEYPDGAGVYGLQVRVTCQGVKSYVAGTTSREGKFLCELPVRIRSGLTYDVDVTWPRDLGGDVERKSITLNADRTEFTLPFYRRLHP